MSSKAKPSFYTVQELAEILQLSHRTILRHIHAKQLAAHRVGHQYRISERAMEEYLRVKYTMAAPRVF
jgi:excisionase family DNA binding protein